jgi:PAS domain S-box-containing protein
VSPDPSKPEEAPKAPAPEPAVGTEPEPEALLVPVGAGIAPEAPSEDLLVPAAPAASPEPPPPDTLLVPGMEGAPIVAPVEEVLAAPASDLLANSMALPVDAPTPGERAPAADPPLSPVGQAARGPLPAPCDEAESALVASYERQLRLYEGVASTTPDFHYAFDREGRFIYANRRLLEVWGMSLADVVGKTCRELGYEQWHHDMHMREIAQVLHTREGVKGEVPFRAPRTGVFGVYEYIFSPVPGPDGEVEFIAGTTRDVTERKRTEDELRYRGHQVKALLDNAPLGVCLVDADLRIVEANPVARGALADWADLVGRELEQVMEAVFDGGRADEMMRTFRHTRETGEPHVAPERAERRRGSDATEYFEWRVYRIPLPDGRHGLVCYFRDISTYVHAREALREADRRKDEFLATLAHELRNPLAPVRNAVAVLNRLGPPDPRLQTAREIIDRQVTQMVHLIDDLLDVSRITHGKLHLRRARVAIERIVEAALETSAPHINHQFSVELPGESLELDADATRLAQVFSNLLSNAAKYTPRGGHIGLTVRREGRQAVVVVEDDGFGISREKLGSVFEMFRQVSETVDRSHGGLGIGLALARRLVEMHGGTIEAHSDGLGKGCRFVVRLPLAEDDGKLP